MSTKSNATKYTKTTSALTAKLSKATEKRRLATLSREMLEAWEQNAWGKKNDSNYANFLRWLATQVSKLTF